MYKVLIILFAFASISLAETEIIGTEDLPPAKTKQINKSSFHKGANILNPGFLGYGGSLIGFEYEYGILDFLGIQIGGGFLGINAGPNFHVLRAKHADLYFAPNVVFIPGVFYLPCINFASRFYFGQAARVGISGIIGIGFIGNDVSVGNVHYDAGQPAFNIGIGVPIRIN